MFQLLRYNVNPSTQEVDTLLTYEWKNNEEKRIEKLCNSEYEAKAWINKHRLEYGRAKLNAFIQHKRILSETSPLWSYPEDKAVKLESLTIMLREYDKLKDCGLSMLGSWIKHCYPDLVKILPTDKHVTFLGQKRILDELWQFACTLVD